MQWHSKVFGGPCAEFQWWAPWTPLNETHVWKEFRNIWICCSQINRYRWGRLRLLGAPQIDGAPQIVGGTHVDRAPQIFGNQPFRLLRAPQFAGPLGFLGRLIYGLGPWDWWSPWDCGGLFSLLRATHIAGAPRIARALRMAGGPCALHNMHNPLLRHCGNGT